MIIDEYADIFLFYLYNMGLMYCHLKGVSDKVVINQNLKFNKVGDVNYFRSLFIIRTSALMLGN
jgi:hypothetical protein